MKSFLFTTLAVLIVIGFLFAFFFTPFGGLNAYLVDQKKQEGFMCQKGFCFNTATVAATYNDPGVGPVSFYYCDEHKSELSATRSDNTEVTILTYYGSFFLIALGLIALVYCIGRVFKGEYLLLFGVLAAAIFTNFIPWVTQVFC